MTVDNRSYDCSVECTTPSATTKRKVCQLYEDTTHHISESPSSVCNCNITIDSPPSHAKIQRQVYSGFVLPTETSNTSAENITQCRKDNSERASTTDVSSKSVLPEQHASSTCIRGVVQTSNSQTNANAYSSRLHSCLTLQSSPTNNNGNT